MYEEHALAKVQATRMVDQVFKDAFSEQSLPASHKGNRRMSLDNSLVLMDASGKELDFKLPQFMEELSSWLCTPDPARWEKQARRMQKISQMRS
eukprot:767363-Hanusia_phi.AAC.2